MTDEENRWKWNEIVQIAKDIHSLGTASRVLIAKRALMYVNELLENGYLDQLPFAEQQLFRPVVEKIAAYIDGDAEVIQAAV
ncbi:hypothetical protein HDV05_006865, partial [Chytridiales sp. JEL 0842]